MEVASAVRRLDSDRDVEVIVLARGGGSIEDLLPFSDEALCRAVAACRTPVISAIGHEQDTPLVDLVADVRASTPTDAGKIVVPDVAEQAALVTTLRQRARRALLVRVDTEQRALTALRARPVLADPLRDVNNRVAAIDALRVRAHRCMTAALDAAFADIAHTRAHVRALSPAATLDRGYAVVQRDDGSVVRDAADVQAHESLGVRLAAGRLRVEVTGADS
jgi:exodeoxyribonuclease VII large subunit